MLFALKKSAPQGLKGKVAWSATQARCLQAEQQKAWGSKRGPTHAHRARTDALSGHLASRMRAGTYRERGCKKGARSSPGATCAVRAVQTTAAAAHSAVHFEQMALQEARRPPIWFSNAILHQNWYDGCEGLRTYTDASSLPVPEAVNTQLQAHHSSSTTTNSTMTCSARRQSQWQSLIVLT